MEQALCALLTENEATLVGFANMEPLEEGVNRGFARGVSIGMALPADIVARMATGPHPDYVQAYHSINDRLDALAELAAGWLVRQGYAAWAATRDKLPYTDEACVSPLPHKTAARLAGHGWIGKNAALVSPDYGSAVRYTTVLTNAPLQTGEPVEISRCGSCTACQRACAAKAVQGLEYVPGMPREAIFDHARCLDMLRRTGLPVCGHCLAAGPHTVAYVRRAGLQMEKA